LQNKPVETPLRGVSTGNDSSAGASLRADTGDAEWTPMQFRVRVFERRCSETDTSPRRNWL